MYSEFYQNDECQMLKNIFKLYIFFQITFKNNIKYAFWLQYYVMSIYKDIT